MLAEQERRTVRDRVAAFFANLAESDRSLDADDADDVLVTREDENAARVSQQHAISAVIGMWKAVNATKQAVCRHKDNGRWARGSGPAGGGGHCQALFQQEVPSEFIQELSSIL